MSSADDAAPKDGGKNEMARVQSELNRRGYYTLEPGGLDRLKKHRLGVELHPSQYKGTRYEVELSLAKAVQNERG